MDQSLAEQYAREHTTADSPLVRELIEASKEELEYTDMISGRLVGRLLAMLIRTSGARRVLEVGTFTGYSALTMAEALPEGGELITCEYNERYENLARMFFEKSEHRDKLKLVMGPALETIPQLEGNFDFVFLDADKNNYPDYYRMILPRMNEGGMMAIDNVLWDGEVLQPESRKARAIDRMSKMIRDEEMVEQVLLPVRDGLTLLRKKG